MPADHWIDPATVRELARRLADRLEGLERYGARCRYCHDAQADTFLQELRSLLGETPDPDRR